MMLDMSGPSLLVHAAAGVSGISINTLGGEHRRFFPSKDKTETCFRVAFLKKLQMERLMIYYWRPLGGGRWPENRSGFGVNKSCTDLTKC